MFDQTFPFIRQKHILDQTFPFINLIKPIHHYCGLKAHNAYATHNSVYESFVLLTAQFK